MTAAFAYGNNMHNAGAFGTSRRRYNQTALIMTFVCGFLTFASAISLIVCGLVVARPTFWALKFENTTCKVVSLEHRGDTQCSCGGDDNNQCRSAYPCIAIHVEYNVTKDGEFLKTMSSMIHEDESAGVNEEQCSAVPGCDPSYFSNNKSVYEFIERKGKMNQSYSCHYNPENHEDVIFERIFTHQHARLALGIPATFLIIGFMGLCYSILALMSKSKLSQQPNIDTTMGGMPPSYPTAQALPPPPPPTGSPFGLAQPYGFGEAPPPPPAYTTTNTGYGGFSANYPRMQ